MRSCYTLTCLYFVFLITLPCFSIQTSVIRKALLEKQKPRRHPSRDTKIAFNHTASTQEGAFRLIWDDGAQSFSPPCRRCSHVHSTAEVAHNELVLTVRAMWSYLPCNPVFRRGFGHRPSNHCHRSCLYTDHSRRRGGRGSPHIGDKTQRDHSRLRARSQTLQTWLDSLRLLQLSCNARANCDNMGPCAHGPMGPWASVPMGPWAYGPMGTWANGPMGPWAWACGPMGPWGLWAPIRKQTIEKIHGVGTCAQQWFCRGMLRAMITDAPRICRLRADSRLEVKGARLDVFGLTAA